MIEFRQKDFARINTEVLAKDVIHGAKVIVPKTLKIGKKLAVAGGEEAKSTLGHIFRRGKKSGKAIVNSAGDTVDAVYKRGLRKAAIASNPGGFVANQVITNVGNEIGATHVASASGPVEVIKKRLGYVRDILNPESGFRQKLEEVAANPGGAIAQRGSDYIHSGGQEVLNDLVTADKIRSNLSNPITGGLGFYKADLGRTAVESGAIGLDKAADRYITLDSGRKVRLGKRYRVAAHRLGRWYDKTLKKPVEKAVNTAGILASQVTASPLPAYAYTGQAPIITGQTGKRIAHSIMSGLKLNAT